MMRVTGQFTFGLEYQGKIYCDYSVRPLTIGGELAAMDALEQVAEPAGSSEVRQTIVETLAYWTQQLTVPGIPAEALSISFLMDNLASEDYQAILDSIECLRVKSPAAGHVNTSEKSGPSGQITK
ncbi:hypothetical protein [Snodgrassella sp. CFCC 13594]|uniref:hypothetical protein n=1 Tax=Snodgrassella sp. CFCC 13594 TaxID=1775559 RepID=UPI00082A842D|nr:hypothetical protein [Snodgrassella sp. CFCC 13594]